MTILSRQWLRIMPETSNSPADSSLRPSCKSPVAKSTPRADPDKPTRLPRLTICSSTYLPKHPICHRKPESTKKILFVFLFVSSVHFVADFVERLSLAIHSTVTHPCSSV